jgi:hypothetical protein
MYHRISISPLDPSSLFVLFVWRFSGWEKVSYTPEFY